MGTECYRSEYVKCGRQCRKCPHGPYWYAYWREGKRTRKRYIGKLDPREVKDTATGDWRELINNSRTASAEIAFRILAVPLHATRDDVFKAYRQLMLKHHPDRGGDSKEAGYVNAAFTYVKARFNW